jgi:predicted P-loop ATPase
VRYKAGAQWWPDKNFEQTHIMPEQAQRYDADCWEEQISSYLKTETKVTIGMVARFALMIDVPRIATSDQRRIAAIMETLGWQRMKRDYKGNRWWGPAK